MAQPSHCPRGQHHQCLLLLCLSKYLSIRSREAGRLPRAFPPCSLFFWAGLRFVGTRSRSGEHCCGMTVAFYPKDSSALRKVFQGLTSPGSLDRGSPSGVPMKMISKSCPMPMPGHTTSLRQLHAISLGKGNSCRASRSFLASGGRRRAADLRRQPCTGLGHPIGGNRWLWQVDIRGHRACVAARGPLPQQRGRIWLSWLSLRPPNLPGPVVPHPFHNSHQPAGPCALSTWACASHLRWGRWC